MLLAKSYNPKNDPYGTQPKDIIVERDDKYIYFFMTVNVIDQPGQTKRRLIFKLHAGSDTPTQLK